MFKEQYVPYTIRAKRTLIRCWRPEDAEALHRAIRDSRESLLPWMPWAKYISDEIDPQVQFIRACRARFDRDDDYTFGVLSTDGSKVLGGTGLHKRSGLFGIEIGYWIASRYQNQGYATETTKALIRTAFDLSNIDHIQLRVDAGNAPSIRVAEKAGFSFEGSLKRRQQNADGVFQNLMTWTIFRSEYERSDNYNEPADAFDILGRPLERSDSNFGP